MTEKTELTVSWGLGTLLEQLQAMNFGDSLDDMSADLFDNIMKHDTIIVNSYLQNIKTVIIDVPANLNDIDLQTI